MIGLKYLSGIILNFTKNHLECINGKLKQVINRNGSSEEFMDRFFVIITALHTERDHKAAIMSQKVKVQLFDDNCPELLIHSC